MQMVMLRLLEHKAFTLVVIGYTLLLAMGSLMNVKHSVETPDNFDKVVHFTAYFGLAFLWMLWSIFNSTLHQDRFRLKKSLFIAVLAIIYGIFMELLQGVLTTYRELDGWDVLANSIGVVFALITVLLLIKNTRILKTKF